MASDMKKIPKVSQPSRQARDIEGLTWTVSRLTARRAPSVLSRLVADVGEIVAELLSSPDKELPPEIEAGIIAVAGGKKLPAHMLKAILFSSVLGRLKELDLEWYVEHIVIGWTSVNGVDIETMAELDETGLGAVGLAQLVWYALEVNFDFISAGLGTSDGNEEPAQETSRVSGTSSFKGARAKGARPDPISAASTG